MMDGELRCHVAVNTRAQWQEPKIECQANKQKQQQPLFSSHRHIMDKLLLDTSSQYTDLATDTFDDICEEQQQQAGSDSFVLPPTVTSQSFENQLKEIEKKFAHGTTTLGFVFNRGIVIAVDSRASMGQYICMFRCFISCDFFSLFYFCL